MTAHTHERICSAFGLGDLVKIDEAGGTRNRNFVFHTSSGKWFVRQRYQGYSDEQRVRFDHEAARFLAGAGVPVMPPLQAKDGNTWLRESDDLWEVYPFAKGRHLLDGMAEDVIALGKSLADFHEAGRSFQLRYEKIGPLGETDPQRLLSNADRLEKEGVEAAALLPYRQALARAAEELPVATYLALPQTLVHGDVQPANILVADGRISAFVDLDWCAWRPRVYDLCCAILVCCAGHKKPVEGDVWSLTQTPRLEAEIIERFLAVYEGRSMPLSAAERKALPLQLALLWSHVRIDNAFKVASEQRSSFLLRDPDLVIPSSSIDWVRPGAAMNRRRSG
jgi:Ser/Thr protein kinase RdoA (MazF antagonist)